MELASCRPRGQRISLAHSIFLASDAELDIDHPPHGPERYTDALRVRAQANEL